MRFCFTAKAQVVGKNRSAGVSPACEPRQLLLRQQDLCRLEAGATFFLTTTGAAEKKFSAIPSRLGLQFIIAVT